ncbi:uncharacterized protein LOC126367830 [Pectinophora gossypiella]|uniref:uncharacterized protein LOC126367830 n=1 Tax=Pectinophora gossypiella TaxID=13191 RepID=UPI00214E2A63|nr:uncharacterized protein LOC126367830 [Pectinophora gossypiella]
MKKICVKILIIFVTSGLVETSPVSQEDSPEKIDVTQSIKNASEINNNYIIKTHCSEDDSTSESCEEQNIKEQNPLDEKPEFTLRYQQPSILTSVPGYQGYPNVEAMGIGIGNYRGVLYPHVHPKLLAAYGSGYAVNSLPPVLSTYIHGLFPQEEYQRTGYDLDALNPQNTGTLPTLVRPSRMLRATDEELMAQLQHDAIMNNILPTMAVPFARYAAPAYSSHRAILAKPASPTGISAIFPNAAAGGCAQPILFSCTPRIIRGTLKPVAPVENEAPAAYRKEADSSVSTKNEATTKVPPTVKFG